MRHVTVAAMTVACAGAAFAQDSQAPSAPQPAPADSFWSGVKAGMTFEGYYQFAATTPPDRVLLLRAYDTRSNTFSIQQAAVVLEAPPAIESGRRFGMRLDLQFGQATETVQGSAANEPRPDAYRHIWQAYGTYVWPAGNGLTTDFGKFASSLGYETNYAKDNQAFSRAYLFNFLPFYHSGLRVSYPVNDKLTVMYMLTNGIQQTEDFNDYKSNHVAAIIKPLPSLAWTINYYAGKEQPDGGAPDGPDGTFRVADTYVAWTPARSLTLGLDVNHVTNAVNAADPDTSLQGVAAYLRTQVTPRTAAGLRWERLDDEGLFGGVDQLLQEITLTGELTLAEGFVLRGEFRRDWSTRPFFTSDEGLRRGQNTLLVGGVWWAGTKKGAW